MKFGANSFIWVSPFSNRNLEILEKVKAMGFDVFELALEDPALVDPGQLRDRLQQLGLDCTVCGAFGPTRDLSSQDASIRSRAFEYLRALVNTAVAVGAGVVNGPMYSAVGKARLLPPAERRRMAACRGGPAPRRRLRRRARRASGHRTPQPLRDRHDRHGCPGIGNDRCRQAANLGLHLDTFHMHLEEKDSAAAIRLAGPRLFHFHACENDRGVPGTGQVHWQAVAWALEQVHYQGAVVIESFTPDLAEIAGAVCPWRPIAPDQDSIAREGLKFLKELFGSVQVFPK
jgi:D-psicose/D-tagatose/L-ribulose 3-epimerase